MTGVDPSTLPEEPRPQLSPLRIAIAIAVIAVLGAASFGAYREFASPEASAKTRATWFAPYVDVTLTPTYAFQSAGENPARDVALGFVVAAGERCEPSWGASHTLDEAQTKLDLDRRIAQLRGRGGDAIVSFGGAANRELALACDSSDQLERAYGGVIKRYSADTIDFDIEGSALRENAASRRRAKAARALQTSAREKRDKLAVWLTLPVTPKGLRSDALAVVRSMLTEKVDLAGVNVMAMNYNDGTRDMAGAAKKAVDATHNQLAAVFGRAGIRLSSKALWNKVGLTVMIGQNDIKAERLTIRDARKLRDYARKRRLGRVSMWSINRDRRCGATFAVVGELSNVCSGVKQKRLEFSKVLTTLRGSSGAAASMPSSRNAQPLETAGETDDPADSPYPIWRPRHAYREGEKVVWHQAVYIANYYTQNQTPDVTPADGAEPWTLVGPVLKGDKQQEAVAKQRAAGKVPAGRYPEYLGTWKYVAGDKVRYKGFGYEAKWYTAALAPDEDPADGGPSPWKRIR